MIEKSGFHRYALLLPATLALAAVTGCGNVDQASPPPQVSTPPPAVSAEAQKKFARDVPNAGLSSSAGKDSTLP